MGTRQLIYFHTGNGGLSFFVEDADMGPLVGVEASAFGHPFANSGVFVKPEHLLEISRFFAEQARRVFREPYYLAAENPARVTGTDAVLCAGVAGRPTESQE